MKAWKFLIATCLVAGVNLAYGQDAKPAPTAPPAAKPMQPAPEAKPAAPAAPPAAPAHPGAPTPPGVITPGTPVAPAVPVDPNAPQPKLEMSATEWDMGQKWAGEPAEGEITVKNVGEAPMNIDVRTSCGCTAAKKPKNPLGVGESDTIKISYNTMKRIGAVSQTVTVQTNDPLKPQATVTVKGEVKALYKMDPESGLTFNRLGKNSNETREATIVNQYSEPLNLTMHAGQETTPNVTITLEEIEKGAKWKIKATTKPPLSMGALRNEVLLDTGIEKIKELHIPIVGYVQPPIQISPPVLYVPATATQRMERMVRVMYLPDDPIKITEIKCSIPSMTATVAPLPENAPPPNPANPQSSTYEVRISVPPAEEIPETGAKVEIYTDAKDPEYKVLKVDVTAKKPTPGMPPVQVNPGGTPGVTPMPGIAAPPKPAMPPATPGAAPTPGASPATPGAAAPAPTPGAAKPADAPKPAEGAKPAEAPKPAEGAGTPH